MPQLKKWHHQPYTRGVMALLGVILCWGYVPVALRELTHSVDSWVANGIRFPLAAVLYWPVLVFFYRRGKLTSHVVRQCLVPALCIFSGQIIWALSPYYLPAAPIGFLVRMSMVFSILFAMFWIREERRLLKVPNFYLGLLVSFLGLLFLSMSQDYSGENVEPFGVVLILTYSVIVGFYAVSVQLFLKDIHPLLSFGVIAQFASLGLFVGAVLFGDWSVVPALPISTWVVLLVSSLLGVATAHFLMYIAIQHLGTSLSSSIQNLTPFVTALLAWLFLQESLSSLQWIGGIAIVLGSGWLLSCHLIVERDKRNGSMPSTTA